MVCASSTSLSRYKASTSGWRGVGGTNLLDKSITLAAGIALHRLSTRHREPVEPFSEEVATEVLPVVHRELSTSGTFDASRSAEYLATARREVRRRGAGIHLWVALVHFGPQTTTQGGPTCHTTTR